MKITPEHYNTLKELVKEVKEKFTTITPESYANDKIGKDTNQRFRWDLFWSIRPNDVRVKLVDEIYKYANDTHIDTALKKIVKELY